MKHQSINLILSITLATQAAGLIIKKPHYMRSSTLDTLDHRRQVAQPTLPSNYWWPYASVTWGATATVPATSVMPLIVPLTMVSSSDSTSFTMVSSTSTSDAPTTSTSSSSSISDLPTTTIDPQQTNPTSHVHVSRLSIPIIIASIAGVVVAIGVLILVLCRCCTRRRREHTTRRTSRRRRDREDVEKGWRRVSIDNWEDKSTNHQRSWWNTMFSTRSDEIEEVVPGPRYVGVDDEVERSILLGLDEASRIKTGGTGNCADQLQDMARGSIRRPTHLLSSQPLMPSRSVSTAGLYNDESDQVDDEYERHYDKEQVPWESLRHKSIKRAILAKVDEERKWTDSMRGVRAANAAKGGVGRRQTHIKCDSDFWLSSSSDGGGFRIVAESPPQIPTPPSRTWTSLTSSFPFLGSSAVDEDDLEKEEDPYTPAPARMRSNSNSRSRRGSITSPLRVMQRTNTQAFLRSPPTVTSPKMESALCFTPVLSASKSDWRIERSFDHSVYVEHDDIGGTGDSAPAGGQERMQGQRSGEICAAVAPGTAFTKTYRLRTDRALKRVEAIVESGWTERGVATRIGRNGV